MAADRHEDRSDQAHTTEQTLTQPKHHQLREQVQGSVRQIRARAQRGERQGPGVIDNHTVCQYRESGDVLSHPILSVSDCINGYYLPYAPVRPPVNVPRNPAHTAL